MHTEPITFRPRIRLPDKPMAVLLGLSLTEYQALSHGPLESFRDMKGNLIELYMRISPNNEQAVLDKLKVDRDNVIRFQA